MTAKYWHILEDKNIQCDLCPHKCKLSPGQPGICKVRENRDGELVALNYFVASSMAVDPIEKKPLHNFFPGSKILSFGTYGCNFSCQFCQNYTISKEFSPSRLENPNLTKEFFVKSLEELDTKNLNDFVGVAYTYSEPTVWAETILELGPIVRNMGLKNVIVTNGFINQKPLEDFLEFTDAFNIDLKAFDDDFYKKYSGGRLQPVLETIKTASKKAHVELTNLIIPTLNDSDEHFVKLRDWVAEEVGIETPVHLSSYYPTYKMSLPRTPNETILRAHKILKEKLINVY